MFHGNLELLKFDTLNLNVPCLNIFRVLKEGSLADNGITEGGKITLLPNVESGLLVCIKTNAKNSTAHQGLWNVMPNSLASTQQQPECKNTPRNVTQSLPSWLCGSVTCTFTFDIRALM